MTRQTQPSARTPDRRRRGLVALALALVIAVALVGAVRYQDSPLTKRAQAYSAEIAKDSAALYVTLRTLNAVLSWVQEIEVGGGIVLEGSVHPLKMLEPIDDTIERIADVVFAVMLVTGILAVGIGPVGAVGWAMVALASLVWLVGQGHRLGRLGRKLVAYGSFLAVALPLSLLLASLAADRLTDSVWAEYEGVVTEITGQVEVAQDTQSTGWREALNSVDQYRELAVSVQEHADDLIKAYIFLLSVFVFKILVLPLMLAGAFLMIARSLAERMPQRP